MPALMAVLNNIRSRLTRGRIVSRVASLEILDRGWKDIVDQFFPDRFGIRHRYPLAALPPDNACAANDRHVSQATKYGFQPRELLIGKRLIAVVAVGADVVIELGVLNL